MEQAAQSIRQGSSQLFQVEFDHFRVTSAFFPAGLALPSHYHPRPCLALVLLGQVEKRFPRHTIELSQRIGCTMPPEERHRDNFALSGAQMLVIEPDITAAAGALFAPCQSILAEVSHVSNLELVRLATDLNQEIQQPDTFSRLVIYGLALEMMGIASRTMGAGKRTRTIPTWLQQANAFLHDHFADTIRLEQLAGELGVHPVHLTRMFRRHYGVSPGEYQRQIRIDWVKTQLLDNKKSLTQLAHEAGFADQSHLTRQFKTYFGVTPGQMRRQTR